MEDGSAYEIIISWGVQVKKIWSGLRNGFWVSKVGQSPLKYGLKSIF